MGSRVMHLIIAHLLAEQLPGVAKPAFVLGGVAPDAVTPKERSHFFVGEVRDLSRQIDYEGFIAKYKENARDPYVLGYYTHLIADDIWLKGFFLSWLNNRIEADPGLLPLYHRDFRLLNGQLIEYYGLTGLKNRPFGNLETIPDLEEVTVRQAEAIILDVLSDLEYPPEVLREPLKVFTLQQILGYIETSVQIGLLKLNALSREANAGSA